MSVNLLNPPGDNEVLKEQFTTDEYDMYKPFLYKLGLFSKEELESQWEAIYLDEYRKADEFRRHGSHDSALHGYRKLQALLAFVKQSGIESEDILGRQAVCHYQVIQCYYNLQSENDAIMRELYLFSEVVLDMLKNALKDHPRSEQYLLKIRELLAAKKQVSVEEMYQIIVGFWGDSKGEMEDENKVWLWKTAYFINRYFSISHFFYLSCTAHVVKADSLNMMANTIGGLAKEILEFVPEEAINRCSTNKVFAQQTKKWLGFQSNIFSAYRSILMGDQLDGLLDFNTEFVHDLKKSIDDYITKSESQGDKNIQDFEYALELLALRYFAKAYTHPEDYKNETRNLKYLYEVADLYSLDRIKQIIQIYLIRLALHLNKDEDEIDRAIEKGDSLRDKCRTERADAHILDKWMMCLKAENLLRKHKNGQIILNQQRQTQQKCFEVTQSIPDEDSFQRSFEELEEIEKLFEDYTDPQSRINLKRGAFLPLEAQTYFLLGQANVEKAKVIANRLSQDEDDAQGEVLLDSFEKARNYLCEAYSILRQMGYKEKEFLDKIADEYIEMVRLIYRLSFLKDDDIKERTPKREDMDSIVLNFEKQKWIEIVFNAIQTNSIDPNSDYVQQLALSVGEGIKHIIPEVCNLFIVSQENGEWDLSQFETSKNKELIKETLENSKGNPVAEYNFYHEKRGHGKIMLCLMLDKDEKRKLILEIDVPLNAYENQVLTYIKNIIAHFLKHFDSKKDLGKAKNDAEYGNTKSILFQSLGEILKQLFSIHKPTLTHSVAVAEMLLISVQEMKKEDPTLEIDEEEVYYAGLLHDIGKNGLDPFLILDKAAKLLPYERKRVEDHAPATAKRLRGLLGFKHFKNVIAGFAHHIPYGVEHGYPFNLVGNEISKILFHLGHYLEEEDRQIDEAKKIGKPLNKRKNSLTDEEKEFLYSEDAILSPVWVEILRDLEIIDQLQAIRAKDRNYRTPISLKDFEGYILSRIGRDFDPERALRMIKLIREGKFSTYLAHTSSDVETLSNLATTFLIDWDDICKFLFANRLFLEEDCGVPFDSIIEYFEKGKEKGLKLGYSALNAGFCQVFIDNENQMGLRGEEARKAGVRKYFQHRDKIFEAVNEYFEIAA